MIDDCEYCLQWNKDHPDEAPRVACGPCDVCRAPGHVGAHPRRPSSVCLCKAHWGALTARGYHFEPYHLIYVIIFGIAAAQIYPLIARLWGG